MDGSLEYGVKEVFFAISGKKNELEEEKKIKAGGIRGNSCLCAQFELASSHSLNQVM